MENLLILVFIGIISSIAILKNKISNKPKMIISALAGTILIVWFWLIPEGLIYWKIIVTVVVTSSLFKLIKTWKNGNIQTK